MSTDEEHDSDQVKIERLQTRIVIHQEWIFAVLVIFALGCCTTCEVVKHTHPTGTVKTMDAGAP